MDKQEFYRKNQQIRQKLQTMQKQLDDAFEVNRLQKQRLISYDERLMVIAAELKSIEKQMRKKQFSIFDIFKKN